jgi:NitT/TauT family transport system permease protein
MSQTRIAKYLPPVAVLVGVIALWEAVILLLRIPHFVIPAPHAIVEEFINHFGYLAGACLYTMYEAVVGFVVGAAIGVLIAVAFFYFPRVEKTLVPIVTATNSVPIVAFAPLTIIWLGVGATSKIALAVIASFFTVVVNTLLGFRCSDPLGVSLMRSFGASEVQIFFKFRWPSALPHIFVGLRNASIATVIVCVVAEILGSAKGVGYIVNVTTQTSDFLLMWAAVIGISAFGVLFYLLVYDGERRFVWWSGNL